MLTIDILAAGKVKNTPYAELCHDYLKQIKWKVAVNEYDTSLPQLQKSDVLVACDERGVSFKSRDFANQLKKWEEQGRNHIQFIIGAADGIPDDIKLKSDMLISFGTQTWPHLMARTMLIEQIYRAHQILSGHPYHRD